MMMKGCPVNSADDFTTRWSYIDETKTFLLGSGKLSGLQYEMRILSSICYALVASILIVIRVKALSTLLAVPTRKRRAQTGIDHLRTAKDPHILVQSASNCIRRDSSAIAQNTLTLRWLAYMFVFLTICLILFLVLATFMHKALVYETIFSTMGTNATVPSCTLLLVYNDLNMSQNLVTGLFTKYLLQMYQAILINTCSLTCYGYYIHRYFFLKMHVWRDNLNLKIIHCALPFSIYQRALYNRSTNRSTLIINTMGMVRKPIFTTETDNIFCLHVDMITCYNFG